MNQVLELPDKGSKATIIKMLQQAITNLLEINKKLKISTKNRGYKK